MAGTPPAYKEKSGSVQAAVWENTGEYGKFYTVGLHRSYLKKGGDAKKPEDWETTNTYRVADLPDVELVCRQCYAWIKQHILPVAGEKAQE